MTERHIVALSAGLGRPSSTRLLADRLAEATATELADRGQRPEVRVVELRDHAHDIVNAMLTGVPSPELAEVIEAVTGADALIAVTPLFTTTYSGLFKSFVDVLDKDSLVGLPVLLGATGGTARHSLALEYSIRPLFTYLRADVATTSVFAATDDWAAGATADEPSPLPARIRRAGAELATTVAARGPRGPQDPFAGAPSFADLLGG
ncbi:FMN reductase [Cellulomonas pakistanensis]|uniref:FMN reductase n=1 Tax=Cellulomonas pakistanensis TaxID=992287 RepID=A0A919PAI7_9CELL|nr:FMN reductase [Cellulomonas pakistanensis]GIG37011.1 FMN reductase [Cellulomonas pakistanensis]